MYLVDNINQIRQLLDESGKKIVYNSDQSPMKT